MYYIFIDIGNYNQLKRLIPEKIEEINTTVERISSVRGCRYHKEMGGYLVSAFKSSESSFNPNIVDAAFQIYETLLMYQEELFGFSVVLEKLHLHNQDDVVNELKKLAFVVENEDQLWVGPGGKDQVAAYLELEEYDTLWQVVQRKQNIKEKFGESVIFRTRPDVIETMVEAIAPFLNNEIKPGIVHIYGEELTEKRFNLGKALEKIMGNPVRVDILRLSSIYKTPSVIHPFLQSVRPEFLENVSFYLNSSELKVWEAKKGNLLLQTAYSDHRVDDFFTAYLLFVKSFIRKMVQKNQPAFIVCEYVDNYHPETILLLQRLFAEFEENIWVIPICITKSELLPIKLRKFNSKFCRIPTMSLREAEKTIEKCYPETTVSYVQLDVMLQIAEGKCIPLFHALWNKVYQKSSGDQHHTKEEPGSPFDFSWELISSFDQVSKNLLFAIRLSEGILSVDELILYFHTLGIDEDLIREKVNKLIDLGFLILEKDILRILPHNLGHALDSNLDKSVKETYKKEMTGFIYNLWKKGYFTRYVSLFSFLQHFGSIKCALDVLSVLVHQKLDEKDIPEADYFLGNINLFGQRKITNIEQENIRKVLSILRLRRHLLCVDSEKALSVFTILQDPKLAHDSYFDEDMYLQQGRYYLAIGETRESVIVTKKSLLLYQDFHDVKGSVNANLVIAFSLFLEERIEEALDFFRIAKSISLKGDFVYGHIRSLIYEIVALFKYGNFSKCLELMEEDLSTYLAAEGARDFELYGLFLKGRVFFEIGEYEKGREIFLEGISLSRIYDKKDAVNVLYAWFARCCVFLGEYDQAERIFEDLNGTPEVLFFHGESLVLRREYDLALDTLSMALEEGEGMSFFPDEMIRWDIGFRLVDDWGYRQEFSETSLYRLIQCYKNYAHCMVGQSEKGRQGLYLVTRETKKIERDGFNYLYFFIYSLVLPGKSTDNVSGRVTALSKALKYFQQRYTKIEDSDVTQLYQKESYWNFRLINDARKYKLV